MLSEDDELVNDRGSDLRALIRSLSHTPQTIDVLRNGPVPDGELHDFADVYPTFRKSTDPFSVIFSPSGRPVGGVRDLQQAEDPAL